MILLSKAISRGTTYQQTSQAIAWCPKPVGGPRGLTNLKQKQCQCIKFAMTVQDMISPLGAPPDSPYSRFKWSVLDHIVNKPNDNKVESHRQKKIKRSKTVVS